MKPQGEPLASPIAAPQETNRLWTVVDVCRFLGVSKRWLHERTRLGEIPFFKLGAMLRFSPKEITAWAAKFHHSPESNGSSGRAL